MKFGVTDISARRWINSNVSEKAVFIENRPAAMGGN